MVVHVRHSSSILPLLAVMLAPLVTGCVGYKVRPPKPDAAVKAPAKSTLSVGIRTQTEFDWVGVGISKNSVERMRGRRMFTPIFEQMDDFGAKLARAINDGNSRLYSLHPTRFIGSISLPMQDPKLALVELERAAKLPGMRAVNLTENVKDKNVGDESFWPVYARCEQLGLPLFLKNVDTVSERLIDKNYSMMNIVSNPFEATIAATSLMLSGTLDEFPKLEVYLPHAGGFFAFVNPRIEFARNENGGNGANYKRMKQPTSSYLRRFYYDLILHSPKLTRTLIEMVGADRLACGTDRPQGMNIKDPIAYVESIPNITRREAEMILCETPARLLKL
jgi:aminocarboxymuconate-semialdehyde decarboxylase